MVEHQVSETLKQLTIERMNQIPGPKGDIENEAYAAPFLNDCDAIAMYDHTGRLLYAWSQDSMHAWYWHVDYDHNSSYSTRSYHFRQSDDSYIEIATESDHIAKFMRGETRNLFFNGSKFMTTQTFDDETGIQFGVMGGKGRGLHTALTPDRSYLLIVAASEHGLPTEHYVGITDARSPGDIRKSTLAIAASFRHYAAGALGV